MDTAQIWFIPERLCTCLQRAQTNRWLCVWQWKENPNLSEAQVQGMALARQATIDMELKHREAVYRDILNKQQTVISTLYGLLISHLPPLLFTRHKPALVTLNLGNTRHLAELGVHARHCLEHFTPICLLFGLRFRLIEVTVRFSLGSKFSLK